MIPERCPLKKTNFDGWPTESVRFSIIEGRETVGLIAGNVHTDLPVEEQLGRLEVTRQKIAEICRGCDQEGCDSYMFNTKWLVANIRIVNPDDEERGLLEEKLTDPFYKLERIKK